MNLSVFTTITRPEVRGDNYDDAEACYNELADELAVIDGHGTWPQEFNWPVIGEHFQRGYEACTGDVVIHADVDFIFHDNDFPKIREAAQYMLDNHLPAMSFYKYQFILPDRYNLKSRLVVMVNKRDFGSRIKFDSGGDLCQPSLDGVELKPDTVPEAQVPIYNYEKLTKTKAQIMDDVGRMDRAYHRHFGRYVYGTDGSDESAYNGWLEMVVGRFHKPSRHIKLNEHPKYVQETISNLKPNQWGYNMFDLLEGKAYA